MAKKAKKSSVKKSTKKVIKPIVQTNQWIMVTKPFKLKVSNFCFPATIRHTCEKCGNEFETNFDKEGLYYPDINEPFTFSVICKKCLRRKTLKLQLHISLEIIHNE